MSNNGKAIIIHTISFAKNNLGQVEFIDDKNYIRITANEDLTISFTNNIEYKLQNSAIWRTLEANEELEVFEGQYVKFKSNLIPTIENGIGTFNVSGEFEVSGDLITLSNDILNNYNFKNLFKDCSTLVNANDLVFPDNVSIGCYEGMFKNCTSLETSPILPSLHLSNDCYKEMFYGCSSLNKIIVNSLDSLNENYSENWVYGVADTGLMQIGQNVIHETGVNGIPEGWEAKEPFDTMYFTIESLEDSNAIKMQRAGTPNNTILSYSLDDGETWTTTNISGNVTFATINTGDKIIFKGNNTKFAAAWDKYNYFTATKQFKVYGNIMSLFNGDNFKTNYEFNSSVTHHCAGLFRTTYLVDASDLILPALTLYSSSYNGMFRGATALQHGPQMLATTPTGTENCSSMFEGCINLEEPIEINFTTLSQQCCMRMFLMDRNSKITTPKMTKSPILRCKTAASDCYKEMFRGNGNLNEITCLLTAPGGTTDWIKSACTNTGTFYKNPSTTWDQGGTGNVPSGWTIVNYTE